MTPFILQARKKLPPENEPSDEQFYERTLQLWIDRKSGVPLVTLLASRMRSSQFGETKITETPEGVDASEETGIAASTFGETTLTKTSEGADQFEITTLGGCERYLEASRFGETQITATREGIDQSELSAFHGSQFGETTLTRTSEGADQTEATASIPRLQHKPIRAC